MKQEELAIILKSQGGNAAVAGELIQQYALAAKSHALAAQKNDANSMHEYRLSLLEHRQQINLYLKAIKEYALFIKNRHSWWQEFSVNTSK